MSALFSELAELLRQGGVVAPPLVACGLLLWLGLGYRFVLLFLGDRRPVRTLVMEAREGRLGRPNGVLAEAAAEGTAVMMRGPAAPKAHLEERFHWHENELNRFGSLCQSVVRVAPLLGLLGTVSGMIETFDSLGSMTLMSQGGGVAGGISEALFSTQMGLMVAIPGLLIGRLFDKRAERIRDELTKLKDVLTTEAWSEEARA